MRLFRAGLGHVGADFDRFVAVVDQSDVAPDWFCDVTTRTLVCTGPPPVLLIETGRGSDVKIATCLADPLLGTRGLRDMSLMGYLGGLRPPLGARSFQRMVLVCRLAVLAPRLVPTPNPGPPVPRSFHWVAHLPIVYHLRPRSSFEVCVHGVYICVRVRACMCAA